jgi:glycosyltransferase involved in cell wall biosynthesis
LSALVSAYSHRIFSLCRKHRYELLWIEKEALPWVPAWLERLLLGEATYVLDYDDAIFHNYDLHRSRWVRHLYGKKLDGLMARARLVVAGNRYLAERARSAGARWVEVVPTVIDLERYPAPAIEENGSSRPARSATDPLRVVWIGSPSTLLYLQSIAAPLQCLATRVPFVLRVIGGGPLTIPGVDVEVIDWTEDTEVKNIRGGDVGVMPLYDSPWERGKCGYKLIQYMACGLPVVASAVGVNPEIVTEGENGFLATSDDDWVKHLTELLQNKRLRQRMGAEGRSLVERKYCIQQTGPRLTQLLLRVSQGATQPDSPSAQE